MKCPKCGAEMYSPLINLTRGEKLWKCKKCRHREIEQLAKEAK